MRLSKTILPILLVFGFLLNVQAQDRHFTLFNFAPLVTNPAYTGAYEGTVRVGGLFRDQSLNIPGLNNVYLTQDFFVDAPLLNVRDRDWVGVGINIYNDEAGTFGLGYQTFHASVAYHLSLDKRNNNVLTLGIQGGTVNRSISGFRGRLGVAFDEVVAVDENFDMQSPFGTTGGGNMNDPSSSFFDLGAGLLLKSKMNEATDIEIGFSLQHITRNFVIGDSLGTNNTYSLQGIRDNDDFTIPTLFVLHGQYNVNLTDVWSISPSFLFQQSQNQNEAVIQLLGGYKLLKRETRDDGRKGKLIKDKDAPKIRFGLGYRLGDALQVLLGFEKGNFRAGIGYDLTLSTLADANGGNGAIEIAANYIFRIYKQPEVDPAILCPKF